MSNKRGRPKVRYTKQEKRDIVTDICNKIVYTDNTLGDLCKSAGVVYRTFYGWLNECEEFEKLYNKAKLKHNKNKKQRIKELAIEALLYNLDGSRKTKTKIKTMVDNQTGQAVTTTTVEERDYKTSDIALALNNLDEDFNRDVILTDENKIQIVRLTDKGIVKEDEE